MLGDGEVLGPGMFDPTIDADMLLDPEDMPDVGGILRFWPGCPSGSVGPALYGPLGHGVLGVTAVLGVTISQDGIS